ncbi:MAG: hypothetical protein M1814_000565 [Vezdaea aestivalis]|nr:MAG: hypothetical protein M1814_000565 [Vezdaea aestivalis]
MSASPQHSATQIMPGAFSSDRFATDQTLPPKLDLNVDTKSHIFQPPRNSLLRSSQTMPPNPSSSRRRTAASSVAGHKRTHSAFAAGSAPSQGAGMIYPETNLYSVLSRSTGVESPPPFVNTKYRLAGGLDSPSIASARLYELDEYDDMDDRRNIGLARPQIPRTPSSDLLGEHNGRARVLQNGTSPGWGHAVISVVGGVAGKVWQFGSSAFKGFYAGGGKGYSASNNSEHGTVKDFSPPHVTYRVSPNSTPIPGQFPLDDYIPDYISTSPERSTKRVRPDGNAEHWVLVPSSKKPSQESAFKSGSPRRPAVAASRRPIVRKTKRAPRTPVSGSPITPLTRPSMLGTAEASPLGKGLSPAAADAQRFSAKRRKEEREANASMERFSRRLKDMIREGKEALGTRIDVGEEDEEDEMETDELVKMEPLEDEGIEVDDERYGYGDSHSSPRHRTHRSR